MVSVERDGVLQRLKALSTERLTEMLRRRDTSQWREEVFEIAEQLLAERLGKRHATTPATGKMHVVVTAEPVAAPAAPPDVSSLAFEEARADAIAIHCSDGRFSQHLDRFLTETLQIPRCDRLAVPGGPALLAGRLMSFWESSGVENQVRFLVEAHALRRIVLVAHEGCGYYARKLGISPATIDQAQVGDLERAARNLARVKEGLGVTAYMIRRREDRVVFEAVSAADLAVH